MGVEIAGFPPPRGRPAAPPPRAQEDVAISYNVASSVVSGRLQTKWHAMTDNRPYIGIPADHAWRRATAGQPMKHRGDTPRAEQRLLAQLRAGKSPVLESYLSQIRSSL